MRAAAIRGIGPPPARRIFDGYTLLDACIVCRTMDRSGERDGCSGTSRRTIWRGLGRLPSNAVTSLRRYLQQSMTLKNATGAKLTKISRPEIPNLLVRSGNATHPFSHQHCAINVRGNIGPDTAVAATIPPTGAMPGVYCVELTIDTIVGGLLHRMDMLPSVNLHSCLVFNGAVNTIFKCILLTGRGLEGLVGQKWCQAGPRPRQLAAQRPARALSFI